MKRLILITCWLFCSAVVMAQGGVSENPPRKSMRMQAVELGLTGTGFYISFNQEMKNVTVRVFNENGTIVYQHTLDAGLGSKVVVPAGKPGIYVIQVTGSDGIPVHEWEIET